MLSKTCTACNTKFYSITPDGFIKFFHKQNTRLDGFANHCKKCMNKYKRAYRLKNPQQKNKKPLLDKNCIVCGSHFQTRRESTEACSKECSYTRRKARTRLKHRFNNYNEVVKSRRAKEIKSATKQRLHYTKEEIMYIKANMDIYPITRIAKKLNRTYYGVYFKVCELKGKPIKKTTRQNGVMTLK